jgi:hypothetical protein
VRIDDQFKIDLTAERIDSRDFYVDVVAEVEFLAVAAEFDDVFFFVAVAVVIGERRQFTSRKADT